MAISSQVIFERKSLGLCGRHRTSNIPVRTVYNGLKQLKKGYLGYKAYLEDSLSYLDTLLVYFHGFLCLKTPCEFLLCSSSHSQRYWLHKKYDKTKISMTLLIHDFFHQAIKLLDYLPIYLITINFLTIIQIKNCFPWRPCLKFTFNIALAKRAPWLANTLDQFAHVFHVTSFGLLVILLGNFFHRFSLYFFSARIWKNLYVPREMRKIITVRY